VSLCFRSARSFNARLMSAAWLSRGSVKGRTAPACRERAGHADPPRPTSRRPLAQHQCSRAARANRLAAETQFRRRVRAGADSPNRSRQAQSPSSRIGRRSAQQAADRQKPAAQRSTVAAIAGTMRSNSPQGHRNHARGRCPPSQPLARDSWRGRLPKRSRAAVAGGRQSLSARR